MKILPFFFKFGTEENSGEYLLIISVSLTPKLKAYTIKHLTEKFFSKLSYLKKLITIPFWEIELQVNR